MRDNFDDLPDDPLEAFVILAKELNAKLEKQIEESPSFQTAEKYRLQHMSDVLSLIKELEITELSNWRLPSQNITDVSQKFYVNLHSYILGASVRNSKINKRNSANLNEATKARIHNLINEIRRTLDSLHIDDRKRNSLMAKLNAFASDIDKKRTRFDNLMGMILEASVVAKEVGETLNPFNEFLKRVTDLLSVAKEDEGTLSLPPSSPTLELPAPPKQITGPESDKEQTTESDGPDSKSVV
ncbi:hypothetical protein ACQKKX_19610 [Neorhizobium sp. NPDC001467]|uniref:hypothetical protein n=1 Tax=Neorhizobium sp. NPDC001467 TaxID=3390595 RepID=UPI003D07575B